MREKRIQIEGQDTPYLVRDDGTIWSEKRKRILKGTIERNEYHTVYLSFNNRQYNFMVHRLVAEAFCENPNGYTIVHHKDENKQNNCADNLEWVTTQENINASIHKRKKMESSNYFVEDFNQDWKQYPEFPDYWVNKDGRVVNKKTRKILIPSKRNGYLRLNFYSNKNNYKRSLHRVLYETFNGPIPKGMLVDHIDGNRVNNALSNLRLVTQSDNMKAAMLNGHSSQISVLQFDKQGNFIQEFPTIQAAAGAVGVTHAAIRSAILREGTSGGYKWEKKSQ